jgi:4-amino-4-deoxy-L-arabinose transferase-like glycosyltransferase
VLCLLLYFPFLGARDFWDHENEYAEVTRVMFLDGSFVRPEVNGKPWPNHAPLFFGLVLFLSRVSGRVDELTMRLVPAMFATVLILICYFFWRKRFGVRIAFFSTLVLATSLLTIHVERHLPINMVLFLFVIVAMHLLMEVLVFGSARFIHVYGVWVFLAMAWLTRGSIGLLLPMIGVCLYFCCTHEWKKFFSLRPLTGGLLFAVLIAPWAALTWKTSGGSFWQHHHVGHGHTAWYQYATQFPQSLAYSIANFPIDFLPWSFLVVPALIALWPERSQFRDKAVLFLFLWFCSVLLFPQYSVEDHTHYIFLILIPAALALGVYLEKLLSSVTGDPVRKSTHRYIVFFCYFLAVGGAGAPLLVAFFEPEMTLEVTVFGLTGLAGALGLLYALRAQNLYAAIFGMAGLMVVFNLVVQGIVLPPFNKLELRPFAERVGEIVKSNGHAGIFHGRPIHDFNFYSGIKKFEELTRGRDAVKFLNTPGANFILLTQRRIARIEKNAQGHFHVVLKQPTAGLRWWFPDVGRWVLVYSCKEACGAPPVGELARTPFSPDSDVSSEASTRPRN